MNTRAVLAASWLLACPVLAAGSELSVTLRLTEEGSSTVSGFSSTKSTSTFPLAVRKFLESPISWAESSTVSKVSGSMNAKFSRSA